ncbi:MAG: serine protease AprX [Crocinitomicaceae bacterium]|jgi:serine protease AprX
MSMKKFSLVFLFLLACSQLMAQETMIIFLKDKEQLEPEQLQQNFSERALQRRLKNRVQFDQHDWPVTQSYLDLLAEHGKVLQTSRWLNAVKFETETSASVLQIEFDFISEIQTFSKLTGKSTINKWELEEAKALNYGYADTQALQINANCLHDLDFTGVGVYVAIIDAGFRGMDTIPYFDSLYLQARLLDSHDFINDSSVYAYSGHGTSVTSTIVAEGNFPDAFTGTGKDVDLALYVSEDVASETQLEEFNLIAALERCDSVGVDIANISLGYFEFDDSLTNYIYDDLDGQTTISAIGVTIAASKGIIVVSSAGNSGPDHITTPADADSILSIGAIDGFENYAWFSGVGPSFDGRVKPDVVSRGGGSWFIASDGLLKNGNGTSFSSPIIAGAVACLVQAYPTRTAQEIIQMVRESGHQFAAPDTLMGYGIPDFCKAFLSTPEIVGIESSVFPIPADDHITIESAAFNSLDKLTIQLIDLSGRLTLEGKSVAVISNSVVIITEELKDGFYILTLSNNSNQPILQRKILVKH